MNAWAEIIQRQQIARDAELLQLMRIAHHADKKSYNQTKKKMQETGQ